jgi:hypothetical protein
MIRTLRAFFLLLAGIAVVVHMVIPHDHHVTAAGNTEAESCPVQEEPGHHLPVFPVHCHAFNDLAAEKFTPQIEKKENLSGFTMLVWSRDELSQVLHISNYSFIEYGESLPEIFLSEFSPLRAPPHIV